MSIPTVVFLKNGKEVERKVGAMPAAVFRGVLDKHLDKDNMNQSERGDPIRISPLRFCAQVLWITLPAASWRSQGNSEKTALSRSMASGRAWGVRPA